MDKSGNVLSFEDLGDNNLTQSPVAKDCAKDFVELPVLS
jgi:hypothetical protein